LKRSVLKRNALIDACYGSWQVVHASCSAFIVESSCFLTPIDGTRILFGDHGGDGTMVIRQMALINRSAKVLVKPELSQA
jgi:hypothetical protein